MNVFEQGILIKEAQRKVFDDMKHVFLKQSLARIGEIMQINEVIDLTWRQRKHKCHT